MNAKLNNDIARQQAAVEFASLWNGRGYEKGDTATFWNQLLSEVVGMADVVTNARYEKRTERKGFVDVTIADAKTIIEQKSLNVDLDKPELRQGRAVTPFEQAREYANSQPYSLRPRYIIVCNFNEFRIHDLDHEHPENNYVSFTLAELPEQFHLLDFLIDPQMARQRREERVSMDAGELIGKLYQALRSQYQEPNSEKSQHSLNVLCVRLVFCLFAEDAGLFGKDAFYRYLQELPASQVRIGLRELFKVLDTPVERRDPYLSDALKSFPYVNGGLFRQSGTGDIEIPNFTEDIHALLVEEVSHDTNWAEISPTIFGGVFESTLNPETRAKGGMHYTSPENIHKVIDPLFLDDLKAEMENAINAPITGGSRKKKLEKFHNKIAGLTFFDPACGSGNFLTETYISLRRLENRILSELNNQTEIVLGEINTPLKVSLNQFYGLEINDFAVSVAATALWIAQLQANIEAQSIVAQVIDDLPLHDAAHIHHGNALRTNWADVIKPADCSYIIGNPPFLGYSRLTAEQKQDRHEIFGKDGGRLDYVACWHKLAANYMKGTTCEAALVSTNSICQGQQVGPLWKPLFDDGININFAHKTFTWSNEATDQAHVFCIIVGFSYIKRQAKTVWNYRKSTAEERADGAPREIGTARTVGEINGYLADAPNVFVERRPKPLSDVPMMIAGGKPTEGGNLILKTAKERNELVAKEPAIAPYIRPFSMGADFINGQPRYCLWLVDLEPQKIAKLPETRTRVEAVRQMRLSSKKKATQKKAATPWLFDEIRYRGDGTYIGVPKVSSERRRYIPMGFVNDGMIPGDKLYFIPTDSLFIFGVLMSQFHNAWMRSVGGRLKNDYSYANTIIYNNFVFPETTAPQQAAIEKAAQSVLDARAIYQESTLAELYDPENDWIYPELAKAHEELDKAVETAYGVDFSDLTYEEHEAAIVAYLFERYADATK